MIKAFNHIVDTKGAKLKISKSIDLLSLAKTLIGEPALESESNAKFHCPFHKDSNPSFNIHKQRNFYHCYSCKTGGDAVSLYSAINHIPYHAAIVELAQQFDVSLDEFVRELSPAEQQIAKYITINNAANQHFHETLMKGEGSARQALEYLVNRGLTLDDIYEFKIGFSISSKDIVDYLESNNIATRREVTDLEYNVGYLFNNTLTLPMTNMFGDVYSYHTRTILDSEIKHFSSSSTHPLLDHHGVMFGRHVKGDRDKNVVVLVEGQFDAISVHRELGYRVWAICGVSKFNRSVYENIANAGYEKIIFMPDGDAGGVSALDNIASNPGFISIDNTKLLIAELPRGEHDPDDLIRKKQRFVVTAAINNAVQLSTYMVNTSWNEEDPASTGKILERLSHYSMSQRLSGLSVLSKKSGIEVNHLLEMSRAKTLESITPRRLELQLLATLANSEERFNDTKLKPEIFSIQAHKEIYGIMTNLFADHNTVSISMLLNHVNTTKNLRHLKQYVHYIMSAEVVDPQATVMMLEDMKARRDLHGSLSNITSIVSDPNIPLIQVVDDVGTIAASIAEYKSVDLEASMPSRIVDSVMSTLTELMASERSIRGIELGPRFPMMTRFTSGLQEGHLNTIAGLWSAGKTTLALNWATYMAVERKDKVPSLFITCEMSSDQVANRVLSILSGVNGNHIQDGNLTTTEYDLVVKAAALLEKSELYIVDSRATLSAWLNNITIHRMKYGCMNIFIDYIQLLVPDKDTRSPYYMQLGDASAEMKERAKKSNDKLIINLISQLSAEAKHQTVHTSMSTGGARKIAQDADRYFIVQKLDAEQIQQRGGIMNGNRLFTLDKNRFGGDGKSVDGIFDNNDHPSLKSSLRMGEILSYNPVGGLE